MMENVKDIWKIVMSSKESLLITDVDDLIEEWDFFKNLPFVAEEIHIKSGKKVWWKCKNGHEWQARVADRAKGNGCPYCAGKRAVVGVNDLATLNPTIVSEWDFEKNGENKPEQYCLHSGKRVWWRCKEGHEWQATIDSRTRQKGSGCPYCAGQRVIKGKNDLVTMAPELAEQWNYEKNNNLLPEEVCVNSGKKVWWKCSYGHEWCVSPNNRYTQKTGCSKCSSELRTSYPEQAIFFYLQKLYDNVYSRYKLENGMELDVYIEDIRTGIEYDGIAYHSSDKAMERDARKNEFCEKNDIRLIRVKEVKVIPNTERKDYVYRKIGKGRTDLNDTIKSVLIVIGCDLEDIRMKIDIDVERDASLILSQYVSAEKLKNVSENIYIEWDYEKNGELLPYMLSRSSHKKVWWKCLKGHSWQATMQHRTDKKSTGCPFCSNQKVLEGYNDLQTIYPNLAKQWDWERNENSPAEYTSKSYHKVWWKCEKQHVWEAAINKRVYGQGCPICAGKKVLIGFNDLTSVAPEIVKEWDYDKNIGYAPEDFTKGSNRVVWWRCKKGHSWQEMINRRVSRNTICPCCREKSTR